MNMKELECFVAVAECGSITKAAAEMYISPQGLSSLIKKMEQELGVTLLERSANGVILNKYGEICLEKSKQMITLNKELYHELNNLKRLDKGMIRMVSAYGVLRRLSPDFIFDFSNTYPDVQIDYMEFPDKYVENMLLEQKADIGYAVAPINQELFDSEFLYEEEVMLLVRKDDELAGKRSISFEDIADRTFIIESELFKIHDLFYEKCKSHGFLPNVIFNTSGYSLCHKLCAQGKGISLTLKNNFGEMHNNNLMIIPFEKPFRWQVYMIMNKETEIETNLKKLIEFSKTWVHKCEH